MTLILAVLPITTAGADNGAPGLWPDSVEHVVLPGTSFDIAKTVYTPEIPPMVEVCLLEDETGSFADDIGNLQTAPTASDIYDSVVALSPGARFAVAGFRDYPDGVHGAAGDWVYRLLSAMSPAKANWLNGIAALTAGGGMDIPEAQYDAIVAALQGGFNHDPCGFDPDPMVTKVLVVTTDAPFHLPGAGKPHVNTHASTVAALNAAGVTVVGLKAPGAGGELDALAAATGGNVQPLSSSGADISAAILAGLGNLPVDVAMITNCSAPISVAFDPAVQTIVSGDAVTFTEVISIADDAAPGIYHCQDWALLGGEPMIDPITGDIIYEEKWITVALPFCEEGVNPAGKTPQAPGKGQNEDGFYLIGAYPIDAMLDVFLLDDGSGVLFGPFPTATNIKYMEANGAVPSIKPGPGAVDFRINGQGDAFVLFTDDFGNTANAACLVPPPPK
jgi:hypothetical protein